MKKKQKKKRPNIQSHSNEKGKVDNKIGAVFWLAQTMEKIHSHTHTHASKGMSENEDVHLEELFQKLVWFQNTY